MEGKEKNNIRMEKLVKGEFEIKNKEFLEPQKSYLFRKKLDYNSFIAGFTSGMEFSYRVRKHGFPLEEEENSYFPFIKKKYKNINTQKNLKGGKKDA